MKNLKFIKLQKDNDQHRELFKSLMVPYIKEIDDDNAADIKEIALKYACSILTMQGEYDRHLEACYDNNKLIGFHYGKVDHEHHKGFIKAGYGYIMEFYVKPEFRNNGYGRAMLERIEGLFLSNGVKKIYLTADCDTGIAFWEAMGFKNTGEISPDNGQFIYEK